ncbi:WGR domain-containing protein [Bacillus cereus group sp. TH152-1LC]|uniref:WGR domain-containing protein n=1 Tax=Bacillus cereus group sp. TH152-1LC TaxID=3018060 RepID=UPI0022E713BA|nr:WGR domain-containing protein [Bacillus cereus group sp. TH152-1LC]MDA1674655.1 WGR domain-containing protein [Bacillus cereus group sp. TH152-1LC]
MGTTVLRKELILINFITDEYRFYNIEVESLSYNKLQVIFHHGKLGTKGTKHMKNTTSYKEAMALAYKKFYERKEKDYHEREDLMGWLGQSATTKQNKDDVQNKSKPNTHHDSSKYRCDICNKQIKKGIYDEINKWGRGGGGWDKDKHSVTYKKVLCIECQWAHDIFKKRL